MDEHTYYRQRGLENLKAMVMLANEGLKALVLINGGAIVALLTFLGNAKFAGQGVARFQLPLLFFALGVGAALLGYAAAYGTQFVLQNEEKPSRGERPVVDGKTGEPSWWYRKGAHRPWLIGAALMVTLSLYFLASGAWGSISAMAELEPAPAVAPSVVRVECPQPAPSAPAQGVTGKLN